MAQFSFQIYFAALSVQNLFYLLTIFVQNLFCGLFFVQNLFCRAFGVQNLFCRAFGVQNLFCRAFGVQNLFCHLECKIYFDFFRSKFAMTLFLGMRPTQKTQNKFPLRLSRLLRLLRYLISQKFAKVDDN
ncbi:hypothetical protein BGS_0872 [Beggiatoa sp. SS]|nr:hypothetical protein BGS_0872 [Beggiatoa sp. SS]